MRGQYTVLTTSVGYPITTAETKTWLRESGTTYDDQIDMLIAAATDEAEKVMWRPCLTTTFRTYFDCWKPVLKLWKGGVTAIASIKYKDSNNAQQTLATTEYSYDIVSEPARIEVINAPAVYQYGFNQIEVEFTAGWAEASAVPNIIKTAIMTRVATYYETPQEIVTGTQVHQIPLWFERMLSNYKSDDV